MLRRIWFIFVGVLCIASAAWADLPAPKGSIHVDPRVRFEGMTKHADHVFFLRYSSGFLPNGIPPLLIELKENNTFTLHTGRRIFSFEVVALDRKEFDKRAKADPTLKWLTDKTPGVLKTDVEPPSNVGSVNDKEVPVTGYRVAIRAGKLIAEKLRKDKRRTDTTPSTPMPLWAFGLVSACSLVLLGLWFARRRNSPGKA